MNQGSVSINTSDLICHGWERHAKELPQCEAVIHWDALDKPFRWTYSALFEAASSVALRLIDQGVETRDICAIIMRHNKFFYPVYMGISLIGAIPAVLAYPNTRLHPDKFVYGLSGIARNSGLDWVITERELDPVITPLINQEKSLIKGILFPLEWEEGDRNAKGHYEKIKEKQDTVNSSMPFLLQFSSGTTGLQKGVVLSHQAVLEHVKRYAEAIRMTPQDKIISWLPLYHDMGLIAAFLMPLVYGIPSIQIDPFQWISAPMILLQAISEEKATITWLPNFAYHFLAERVIEQEMKDINLSSMRMFINCSEVVRAESHDKFFKCFGKYGVKRNSIAACYAMAETTFAVTQTEPDKEASQFPLDRDSLSKLIITPPRESGSTRVCVSSGKPISGCELKIVNNKGNRLPEDRIGTIAIKSVSLFDGYLKNPKKTREVMRNGWYMSGDLGFCHKGEYYVLGREDDVIIIAGKNIYPEDIEDAVGRVKGVIPGRLVAFGMDDPETGTQKVCLVAETFLEEKDQKESLRLAIMQAAMEIDVTISTIYLVPPRWLIKSSSGKLCRKTNRDRILNKIENQCKN